MAQLPTSIDCTRELEPITREPLPAGEYVAQVIEDTMKETKAGNGQYLELRMEVLDGDHKGRWIFDRLNLQNPNKTAVEISERQLLALGKACGITTLKDSSELRGIPISVTVKIEKSADYGDRNQVVTYRKAATSSEGSAPWNSTEEAPF